MDKIVIKDMDQVIYKEVLDNGLTVFICKTPSFVKKYAYFQTRYGSCYNEFVPLGKKEYKKFPLGIAHFLEHKLFESSDNESVFEAFINDTAYCNAATSYDRTFYYFSCNDKFNNNLNRLIDMVQSPYFTDSNVEKEKGIIGQEINMYDDYPEWKVYLNALDAMYHVHPVKLDITGTIETISKIDKDILYKCYNTFYNLSNMCLVVSGDFEPEKLIEEIKKRLIEKEQNGEIKRIFEEEPENIVKEKIEQKMTVTKPLFTIGIKCTVPKQNEKVRIHIGIEILLNLLIGESSNLYKELYNDGNIYSVPSISYEFDHNYAHILISESANDPEKIYSKLKNKINEFVLNGINEEDFKRIKKMLYGEYIKEYDDVTTIGRMLLSDYMKGINSFDYLEEIESIDLNFINQVLKDNFKEEKMVLSVVK